LPPDDEKELVKITQCDQALEGKFEKINRNNLADLISAYWKSIPYLHSVG
jgi:hypothetical protein